MLKGFNLLVLFMLYSFVYLEPFQNFEENILIQNALKNTPNNSKIIYKKRIKKSTNKSAKNIKKLCQKSKRKISTLEAKARKKSTPKIQRCKRAYSELRYQSCHLKKYHQRKIDAAKNCAR